MNGVKKIPIALRVSEDIIAQIDLIRESKKLSRTATIESLLRLQLNLPVPNPLESFL
jgi:hypothetical protein